MFNATDEVVQKDEPHRYKSMTSLVMQQYHEKGRYSLTRFYWVTLDVCRASLSLAILPFRSGVRADARTRDDRPRGRQPEATAGAFAGGAF